MEEEGGDWTPILYIYESKSNLIKLLLILLLYTKFKINKSNKLKLNSYTKSDILLQMHSIVQHRIKYQTYVAI